MKNGVFFWLNWCLTRMFSSVPPVRLLKMKRLRVLLAESHPLLRQAIVDVLAGIPVVRLVAKVGNGWDAMRMSTQLKPDIVLTDFSLPGLNGLEVTSLIKRELPQIAVVIFLDEGDEK